MKKECKIVQDLLPNYLEKVTNEETNEFIKEHIVECKECEKIYQSMKQDLKVNTFDSEETINYMKRFKTKLKLLRNILLIIIVIFLIIVGRKAFILAKLFNTSNKLYDKNNYEEIQIGESGWIQNDLNNYYCKSISTYSDGKIILTEKYRKDGKAVVIIETSNIYEKETYIKETFYSDRNENWSFIEDSKKDEILTTNKSVLGMGIGQVPTFSDGYWDIYFKYLLYASIYECNWDGKGCYVIKIDNEEYFVDKDTGIIIKGINNDYNIVTDYYYEFNTVTDDDVRKPDIPVRNN